MITTIYQINQSTNKLFNEVCCQTYHWFFGGNAEGFGIVKFPRMIYYYLRLALYFLPMLQALAKGSPMRQ